MSVTLVMVKADGSAKDVPLERDQTLVGRDEHARLRIPVPQVSRRHCQITVAGSTVSVADLGSSNGTFVNGKRIRQTQTLAPGDLITIGPVVFVVRVDGKPEQIDAKDSYAAGTIGVEDDDDDDDDLMATPPPARAAAPAKPGPKAPAGKPKPLLSGDDDDVPIDEILKDFKFDDDDDDPPAKK